MNERLVITLVLSYVNIQFSIHIQSNKSYSQESVFFVAECSTAVIWGSLSDRFGRRPIMLLGPLGLSFSMLFFGSSTTYVFLVISRFCQGSFNGCVGEYSFI
jgi:MFS family permease